MKMEADAIGKASGRYLRPGSSRVASLGAILCAALMLGGCAVGMLRGAARSGGSSSSSSTASQESRTASRKAADDAISTSVRSKLAANAATKPFNLSADTHDGIVTLRGQVAKVEQRNAAQSDARSVAGVKAVQNLITVR
jgi:osmotically-inducible protein OsmY